MKTINEQKWDVHHHIIPDFYAKALESVGIGNIFGFEQPAWDEKKQLAMMKKHNFSKAYLSISTPGVYFNGPDFSRRLARQCNEYMAQIRQRQPQKFGVFAAMPLPDVDGALAELSYSLDELQLDGVGLLSNVDGNYLGSPAYRRFFAELDRRKAVVFVHPTVPLYKKEHRLLNYMYLFLLDTSRTMLDFVRSGYHREFPNIRFVLAHGGGVLPVIYPLLVERMKAENAHIESEFSAWLANIYVDTARIAYHDTMETAIDAFGIDHVMLGTDYIWAKNNYAYWIKLISQMERPRQEIVKIYRGNARQLFQPQSAMERTDTGRVSALGQPAAEIGMLDGVKYHFHCNPPQVVRAVTQLDPQGADDIAIWDETAAFDWMDGCHCKRAILSLDIPQLWRLPQQQRASILTAYNDEVAAIRGRWPQRFGAFGAVDIENADTALSQIKHCLNELKLDGICLYTDTYHAPLEQVCDERILQCLRQAAVPVLVHPQDSRGVPLENENYLDAVYFVAKMLYLGRYEYLQDNSYILTHTGGVVPFLAQNIGLLYYMQLEKSNMVRFMVDWLVKRNMVGYEYLKRVLIDDEQPY